MFQQLSGQIQRMDEVKQSDSSQHNVGCSAGQRLSHSDTDPCVTSVCDCRLSSVTAILPTACEGNTWSLSCEQDEETFSVTQCQRVECRVFAANWASGRADAYL